MNWTKLAYWWFSSIQFSYVALYAPLIASSILHRFAKMRQEHTDNERKTDLNSLIVSTEIDRPSWLSKILAFGSDV